MNLYGKTIKISELENTDKDSMYTLFSTCFDNVDKQVFISDMAQKDWVIMLYDSSNKLAGFSTQKLLKFDSCDVLFSGDTIVHPEYWSETELMHHWGKLALKLIDASYKPLYWFLISMGYRTYRFLPVFFKEFYPRYNLETPEKIKKIIDELGLKLYSEMYCPENGQIRSNSSTAFLKGALAQIKKNRLINPHVKFFLENNPDYYKGVELACLAPLTRENFNSAAYRMINKKQKAYELSV